MKEGVHCGVHGHAQAAFVCQHMNLKKPLGFWEPFNSDPNENYPNGELQAWCNECDKVYLEEGEWNDKSEAFVSPKLVCSKCFFEMKKMNGIESK